MNISSRTPSIPFDIRRRRPGFTLVEILIVVIILGILAAIVIPQFTNATTEARQTTMVTQVKHVRSLIELYRLQHNGNLPDLLGAEGWNLLMAKTLRDGTIDPEGDHGPYLQVPPINPMTKSSSIVEVGTAPSEATGWYFNASTGDFHGANEAGAQSDNGT
jgi:general secretion pathway protein G